MQRFDMNAIAEYVLRNLHSRWRGLPYLTGYHLINIESALFQKFRILFM
jgi:hypothetical protein